MPRPDEAKIQELQEQCHGIGIFEYLDKEDESEFLGAINEYSHKPIHELGRRDTHPEFDQSVLGYPRELSIPDTSVELFDTVYLQRYAETDRLINLLFYGVIDKDMLKDHRESEFRDQDDSRNIGQAGLSALREGDQNLSNFIASEIHAGLLSGTPRSPSPDGRKAAFPSFWYYALQNYTTDGPRAFLRKNEVEAIYMGLGHRDNDFEPISLYNDHTCLANNDNRKYLFTDVGSFPFRHNILQFGWGPIEQEFAVTDEDRDSVFLSDRMIPPAAERGAINLSRVYSWLIWGLWSYRTLSDHNPSKIYEGENIKNILRSASNSKKYRTMELLQDEKFELRENWFSQSRQFDSIRSAVESRGVFSDSGGKVVEELLQQAENIERYCYERKENYSDQYSAYVDRLKWNLDVAVGMDVRNLSVVIIAFTAVNVAISLAGEFSWLSLRDALLGALAISLFFYLAFHHRLHRRIFVW